MAWTLIRSVSKPAETVFTLDMFNPFPLCVASAPGHGEARTAWHYNHQFNDKYKPTPDQLFGSADIVMVPKHPSASDLDARALFRNYLPCYPGPVSSLRRDGVVAALQIAVGSRRMPAVK